MRILIEEYQYSVADVKDILQGIDALENVEGRVSIHYVGYYYNTLLRDCVFILPKVLLQDVGGQERVFGKYRPEDIANLDVKNPLEPEERNFIYKFAVWIYRAVVVFKNDKRNDTDIVYHQQIAQVGAGSRRLSNTYLDILLSLLQFNRDNQSFFFFVVKNQHSGLNKINWSRTIATSSAIVQKGQPIYLNPINKKRRINFDEELLVIFFSILNYIGDTYGFPKEIYCQYQLITGKRFETYLNGFGKTRLRQIKYKYFSDKALQLWQLCYAFFDQSKQVFVSTDRREYLLVKNFYIVFEAIIDELVGDNPLPDGMDKRQDDGKIVDHLFTAVSLTESERRQNDTAVRQTYCIGDSKYYKMGHELGRESVYKQYTYARNVIQWNLDIFNGLNDTVKSSQVRLRDEKTEGYEIIPNFFISAKLDEKFRYDDDGIEKTDRRRNKHKNVQFMNRLFDRDTMLLFHYDVNFLYVLSLYARNNASQKAAWKRKIRSRFRSEIQQWLQEDYDFYAMRAKPGGGRCGIHQNSFPANAGQDLYTFCPGPKRLLPCFGERRKNIRRRTKPLLSQLRQHFFVESCALGRDPLEVLPKVVATGVGALPPGSSEKNVLTCLVRKMDDNFKNFYERKGKTYTMERLPTINLMGVKYLLPMVAGMIDGYYEIERMAFVDHKGATGLRLRLGKYHNIGDQWVQIYRTKMQPGELISLDYTMKMYNE